MAYKVYLKKGEEKRIIAGHSWVYANEVSKIDGKDKVSCNYVVGKVLFKKTYGSE